MSLVALQSLEASILFSDIFLHSLSMSAHFLANNNLGLSLGLSLGLGIPAVIFLTVGVGYCFKVVRSRREYILSDHMSEIPMKSMSGVEEDGSPFVRNVF